MTNFKLNPDTTIPTTRNLTAAEWRADRERGARFEILGRRLDARLAYLDAVDAAVDAAVPVTEPVAILAVEDAARFERAARDAALNDAADVIFGARS